MEGDTPRWIALLVSWTPFLILILVWIWLFRRKGGFFGKQGYMERNEQLLERQHQLLERIAAALEERNKQGR